MLAQFLVAGAEPYKSCDTSESGARAGPKSSCARPILRARSPVTDNPTLHGRGRQRRSQKLPQHERRVLRMSVDTSGMLFLIIMVAK